MSGSDPVIPGGGQPRPKSTRPKEHEDGDAVGREERRRFLFGVAGVGAALALSSPLRASSASAAGPQAPELLSVRPRANPPEGLLDRISRASTSSFPVTYPRASIRLGPGHGCARPIVLASPARPWPAEIERPDFTVTDPEPHRAVPPSGAPLGKARRRAILERMATVSAAVGVQVHVSFSPAEGVLLYPSGTRKVRDRRAELRIERRRRRVLERETRQRRVEERRRRERALATLEGRRSSR